MITNRDGTLYKFPEQDGLLHGAHWVIIPFRSSDNYRDRDAEDWIMKEYPNLVPGYLPDGRGDWGQQYLRNRNSTFFWFRDSQVALVFKLTWGGK